MQTFTESKRQGLVSMALALALLSAAACVPSRADTFPRQPGIKILHYTFDVVLGDVSGELTVKDTIDLEFLAADVPGIDLNLCKLIQEPQPPDPLNPCLQPVPRARTTGGQPAAVNPAAPAPTSVGRGMTVTSITAAGGEPLAFTHENNLLHVSFPAGFKAGDKLSFTIAYHGVPATGLFFGTNQYGDRVWYTDNWPNKARNWLATIDHISVKAPKTISITAPRSYQVLSNGSKTEETDLPDGLRRTTWTEAMPIPSWQFSLGIAAMAVQYFGKSEGTEFSVWAFPQDSETAFKSLEPQTSSIFEFYSDHIGPYAYEKLAHLEAIGGGGATEPASTIFYFNGSYRAESHEMAHHWFGDAVTERDWDDIWLSEGFATYFALLYTEHADGRDAFLAGVQHARDIAMKYELAHPADTVVHDNLAVDSNVLFNSPQIYQGGAMVLHTLRGVLGDDVFWAGIRLYYSRFRNRSASTADLRHAMEDACFAAGNCPPDHRSLEWFFHEWLSRGGILQLDGSWHYDAAARQLHISLNQRQSQGLYRMPIQVGITLPSPAVTEAPAAHANGAAAMTATFLVDKQENSLDIPVDAAPTAVELDPDTWVPMMQANFVGN